ncbi:surface carbohydrate biosynthesis protein [Bacillus sp. V5-8f]|uniref:surface carbohydrate biosynthesis protein n=1 Tax=Bacillus sp. V5-8f TaxID=2053044 RepID=UPI000C767466|nr:surface carbohydrate biosynthesis protein [Bacillus sp. V5-8f]PLT35479.1 hypothetical protein CUU64_02395 [Bacillus sp. V5-8f]
MSKKWLYLPLEVTTRELDAKLLLTYYCVKQNINIILAEQKKLAGIKDCLPKGIYLSKGYAGPVNRNRIRNAKKLGHIAVELDEEGLICNPKSYLKNRVPEQHFNVLDQIYCWGNLQKSTLVKGYGSSDKLFLTGHPRFDLLQKKFRGLYNDEVKKLKNDFGNFILINTRFAKRTKSKFIQTLYEHFIRMIKVLCQTYPNHKIVIRPHPMENVDSYKNEFKNDKNVIVVHEGNIVKWNLAANIVIHNGCTTGIEAFLLERPVISYMPITSEEHTDENVANELSHKATNLDDLLSLINSFLSDGKNNSTFEQQDIGKKREILSNYYASMDGTFAYEKILRLINNLNTSGEHTFNKSKFQALTSKQQNDNELKKDPMFLYIMSFFNKLDEIEKCKSEITVNKLGSNCYLIELNNLEKR